MAKRSWIGTAAGLAFLLVLALPLASHAATLTVFAAASLKEALDEQAKQFESETNSATMIAYAGSNVLAKQIEAGAPADVSISADLDWMDYLAARKLLAPATRRNLLRNRLVLIAPADSNTTLKIGPGFDLAGALGSHRLAIANPDSVPAGKYAKDALTALGVWNRVDNQVAPTENVGAALALVARGEAPFGIVYATDARAEKNVRVVDVFAQGTHPPIVYPIAIIATSASPAAKAFVDYLDSALARATWERYGFSTAQ